MKYDRNNDSLKRKRTTKGPVLRKKSSPNSASRNKSQNRTNKEQSKGMESHQSELAQTLISGKQTNLMQRFCRTSSKGSNSQLSSARSTTNGLFKKSFKSSFRLKTKPPNQNKTNSGSKVKENLPVCDLDGDFVCPRRQIEKCGIHRANDASFLDRLAALPKGECSLSLHEVHCRMVSVVNFFVFLRLLCFALLLQNMTLCMMWKLYFTFLM